jgi:hypothetical protein
MKRFDTVGDSFKNQNEPAFIHKQTHILVKKRLRASKKNAAATAFEQIRCRVRENPVYFNQKIDELKDLYTQLFPQPLDPNVLDEWRDDLKIWMWKKVAALNPPLLTNITDTVVSKALPAEAQAAFNAVSN